MQQQQQQASNRGINFAHILVLTMTALASSPKGDDEESLRQYAIDNLEYIPGHDDIIEELIERELLEVNEATGAYNITPYGFKYILNAKFPNPNFKMLANSDFSVAVRMMISGQEALEGFVEKSESKQIVPKKDDRLVTTILKIGDWCYDVTEQYRNDKSKTAAKKPSKKA